MRRKRNHLISLLRGLFLPVAAVVALVFFSVALNSLSAGQSQEDLRQLEETLRRSCVACYAAEGAYPPSLAYLKDHYGLQVDETRYTVQYSAVAENLMPDITVLENDQQ